MAVTETVRRSKTTAPHFLRISGGRHKCQEELFEPVVPGARVRLATDPGAARTMNRSEMLERRHPEKAASKGNSRLNSTSGQRSARSCQRSSCPCAWSPNWCCGGCCRQQSASGADRLFLRERRVMPGNGRTTMHSRHAREIHCNQCPGNSRRSSGRRNVSRRSSRSPHRLEESPVKGGSLPSGRAPQWSSM